MCISERSDSPIQALDSDLDYDATHVSLQVIESLLRERGVVDQSIQVMFSSTGNTLAQTHHKTIRHRTHMHANITHKSSKNTGHSGSETPTPPHATEP